MRYVPENPLIVQSDHTLLLETMGPHFKEVRDALVRFAELVKSPEYVYTYRVTPLSLWNAAAAGLSPEEVQGSGRASRRAAKKGRREEERAEAPGASGPDNDASRVRRVHLP